MSGFDALTRSLRLDGKRALVTGASIGFGAHFAQLLASAGAELVLAARRIDKLQSLADSLRAQGAKVLAVALDVSSKDSVHACFDQAGPCDIVINNAGITVTRALLDQTEDDWDSVIDTNLKGGWLVATEAARRLRDAGRGGSFVNIGSVLGERVAAGVAPYAISKAGVVQATKVMALELAHYKIRVNALLPGYVITDLNRDFLESEPGQKLRMRIPSREFVQITDLNAPLLMLASDAGAGMTGACIAVDRGHLVSTL
ncbi:MAG: SDR family NAD(P)-dependent oxidoreductase [Burkholderiaceae bacterium]|jgi:NAD(P)-dependent dehydrogenase (short-subunit alcohol dehydrogenase family)